MDGLHPDAEYQCTLPNDRTPRGIRILDKPTLATQKGLPKSLIGSPFEVFHPGMINRVGFVWFYLSLLLVFRFLGTTYERFRLPMRFIIAILFRGRLHKIRRRLKDWARKTSIKRELGTADSVNYNAGRIW